MRGLQDLLEVFEDKVTITPKGVLGFLHKGIKGSKEIPLASIVAVQFKDAGAVCSGHLQFIISGGNESKGGIPADTKNKNTFMFAHAKNNIQAKEIKGYIDGARRKASDELVKLAGLREQGVLSEYEFLAARMRVIG